MQLGLGTSDLGAQSTRSYFRVHEIVSKLNANFEFLVIRSCHLLVQFGMGVLPTLHVYKYVFIDDKMKDLLEIVFNSAHDFENPE